MSEGLSHLRTMHVTCHDVTVTCDLVVSISSPDRVII